MSASKNPLYVVTNNGKDVQEATSFIDALVKRFGLDETIGLLESMLAELFEMVTSFAIFKVLQDFIDQIVEMLEMVTKKVDPVLAFSIFKK